MRLLRFLALLFIPLLVCLAALEVIYKDYETEADRIFATYNSKAKTVNNLLIGNSHLGVCNYALPLNTLKTGNMCLGNLDIFRIYTLLKVVLPYSPQLKKAYISLDYDMLGYNQTKCGQKYMDYACYKYTHTLYNNSLTNRLMAHSNFVRANRDIAYLFRSPKTNTPVNYIPLDKDSSNHTSVAAKQPNLTYCRQRAQDATVFKFDSTNFKENLYYLAAITALCRQYKVEPIFVNTPKTEAYKSFCDKANTELAKNFIINFFTQNKLTYIDLYSDTAFNDSLFTDGDHLNYSGAMLLARRLGLTDTLTTEFVY